MLQSSGNFMSVPKLKLGTPGLHPMKPNQQQAASLTRENMLQLTQKQSIENQHMMLQKNNIINISNSNNTPNSIARPSYSKQSSGLFSTPKDTSQLNSPLQSQKAFQESTSRVGAFSDYFNKECSKPTSRLPSINKSNSSTTKFASQSLVQDDVIPRPKNATFSSDISNFDQTSTTSTADNLNFKGKSSFFKPKPEQLSQFHLLSKDSLGATAAASSTTSAAQNDSGNNSQLHLSNSNVMTKSLSLNLSKKDQFFQPQNYLSTHMSNSNSNFNNNNNNINNNNSSTSNVNNNLGFDSPMNFVDQAAFLNKQQQQQQSIKALHEEQKKQLQRVEDITSPFPPKSQRKKPSGRMSLNVQSLSDLTNQNYQKSVLNEQLGGESTFSAFVHNLLYSMKKIEFFELFFEEYIGKTEQVKYRVSQFLMSVFTNNLTAVLSGVHEFLNNFNHLTDSNIFELKAFLLNFLTISNGVNNTFPDKKIAFQLIESIEIYRNELTGNEAAAHLYEVSEYQLADNLAEHLVTSEFFKKFELDKLTSFSKSLIALIFNKISCGGLITEFESCFQVSLAAGYLALLRDILKKVMSDLKEFNSVFRKNVSYQLKKVQWLLAGGSQPSYISLVQSQAEPIFTNLLKLLALTESNPNKQKAFVQFIKACYSPFNIFNMIDIFELINPSKDTTTPNETCAHFCTVFKQALINSKVSPDTAKKIETFTLSIFE